MNLNLGKEVPMVFHSLPMKDSLERIMKAAMLHPKVQALETQLWVSLWLNLRSPGGSLRSSLLESLGVSARPTLIPWSFPTPPSSH